jgi:ribosome-binding protein aMBF1 (putative translation factor)
MTKEEIQRKVGQRIVDLRKTKGLKQIELAYKLDIEDSALRRIEKGRTNCTIWLLYRISEALEVSLPELLNFEK